MPSISPYSPHIEAQFMNTYVPIPFQEMLAAGQMKQGRYDQAANAIDSGIAALDEIQAIPNSADELRAKDYSNKMREIRDKYVGRDLSDPFVQRELSNEIHRSVNKEDIKHIQQSYQGYVNYQNILSKYAQEGATPWEGSTTNFSKYDSSRTGVFTGTPSKLLDTYGDTRKFFEDMEMEYQGTVDVAPGVKALKHGITQDRIIEHAKNNISGFMALPSVNQYVSDIIRTGQANGRNEKEIALDYVKAHAPEFRRSAVSGTFQDPNYVPSGNGPKKPEAPKDEYELIVDDATVDAVELSHRKINKKVEEARKKAVETGNPNDINVYNQMLAAKETAGVGIDKKISEYNKKQELLQEEAIKKLIELNIDPARALDYLRENEGSFAAGLPGKRDYMARVIPTTLAEKVLKSVPGRMITSDVDKSTKESFVETMNKMKDKNLSSTPEEVLYHYQQGMDNLNKEIKQQEKLKIVAGDEAINKLFGHQDTYTAMETMFEFDNGIMKEVFYDDNNMKRSSDSPFAKQISNMFYNIGDYQHNFLDDNGELSKSSLKKTKELFDNADLVRVIGTENLPTEDGGLILRMRMYKNNEAGKATEHGKEFKVKMPVRTEGDREAIAANLYDRNQIKTADTFLNYNFVNNEVTGLDLYNGDNEIPLSTFVSNANPDDKIILERVGHKIMPKIIMGDIERDMWEEPVTYGTNGETITEIILAYLKNKQAEVIESINK